jgi:hypothetical protein
VRLIRRYLVDNLEYSDSLCLKGNHVSVLILREDRRLNLSIINALPIDFVVGHSGIGLVA